MLKAVSIVRARHKKMMRLSRQSSEAGEHPLANPEIGLISDGQALADVQNGKAIPDGSQKWILSDKKIDIRIPEKNKPR